MENKEMLRVAVVGAVGRVGREVIRAVSSQSDMQLVAAIDQNLVGKDIGAVTGMDPLGILVRDDLDGAFMETKPHIYVDFSNPLSVMGNITKAAAHKVAGIIGTTGLTRENLQEIQKMADDNKTSFLVAPNFALGAILMMRFAQMAAAYFPQVEIIELHHDQKMDAPSGTAIKTAEMIREGWRETPPARPAAIEKVKGARGAEMDQINIHSIRLQGLVAHQEVIFGGQGQTLSIRHDSISRDSFMPGVMLAIREVLRHPGLTYGLEHFLN